MELGYRDYSTGYKEKAGWRNLQLPLCPPLDVTPEGKSEKKVNLTLIKVIWRKDEISSLKFWNLKFKIWYHTNKSSRLIISANLFSTCFLDIMAMII